VLLLLERSFNSQAFLREWEGRGGEGAERDRRREERGRWKET